MTSATPGQTCPQSGVWLPGENPKFYPREYAGRVMQLRFEAGQVMPATPHGEPYWVFQQQGKPIENFTGLSPEQISAKLK
jgi:hypothetical protein